MIFAFQNPDYTWRSINSLSLSGHDVRSSFDLRANAYGAATCAAATGQRSGQCVVFGYPLERMADARGLSASLAMLVSRRHVFNPALITCRGRWACYCQVEWRQRRTETRRYGFGHEGPVCCRRLRAGVTVQGSRKEAEDGFESSSQGKNGKTWKLAWPVHYAGLSLCME